MGQQYTAIRGIRRAGRLAGLLLGALVLALFLFSPVRAQETLIRIEIDAPVEPVPAGDEFEARVLVDNVEHLAAFDFTIEYDPARVSFERVEDAGQFLTTAERGENTVCPDAITGGNTVLVTCNTLGPPLCLDGLAGASGSGVLGRVFFKSKGGGSATLALTKATLALDDLEPCSLQDGRVPEIAHQREDASVELIGGDDGVSWAVIGTIIGVVVVVLLGGGLVGFLRYRRRAGGSSA